jgi:hypothetical protein
MRLVDEVAVDFQIADQRMARGEAQVALFAGLAFHPIHPLGMLLLEPRHEPLHRLVGTCKSVLLHQILIDALRAKAAAHLPKNGLPKRIAQAFAPPVPGGRNGGTL